MNEYRIEKQRLPVVVVLAGGARIAGDIFLSPVSRFRAAPQRPEELLNEAEPFFALQPGDGAPALIAKDAVERVEMPPMPPESDAPAHVVAIELRLVSGDRCTGALDLDMPEARFRLLDYLNAHTERFIKVTQPHAVLLVNRRAVAVAHEAD